MMLRVDALDQRYVFGTGGGEVQNFLILTLPTGAEVRVPVDLETAKQFLDLDVGSNGHETAPVRPIGLVPEEPRFMEEPVYLAPEQASELLNWLELPDDILPPALKAAFSHAGANARLAPTAIKALQRDIMERFGPEEWQAILGPQWQAMLPKKAAAPRPPLNQLQWADGSPMMSSSVPSRTAQQTTMGYPVLDGVTDIHSVVGGSEADEDGVGSV